MNAAKGFYGLSIKTDETSSQQDINLVAVYSTLISTCKQKSGRFAKSDIRQIHMYLWKRFYLRKPFLYCGEKPTLPLLSSAVFYTSKKPLPQIKPLPRMQMKLTNRKLQYMIIFYSIGILFTYQANHEQAKKALSRIQLAPSLPEISGGRNSNAV